MNSGSGSGLPHQYELEVVCSKCNAQGKVLWEGRGPDRTRVHIAGKFTERLAKAAPHQIELVCQQCGTAQPI